MPERCLFCGGDVLPAPRFDGADYVQTRDHARLKRQMEAIVAVMRAGDWRTLKQIATLTGHPEASISAQLRNLRKKANGSHTVNRRHVGGGLYEYQLLLAR